MFKIKWARNYVICKGHFLLGIQNTFHNKSAHKRTKMCCIIYLYVQLPSFLGQRPIISLFASINHMWLKCILSYFNKGHFSCFFVSPCRNYSSVYA